LGGAGNSGEVKCVCNKAMGALYGIGGHGKTCDWQWDKAFSEDRTCLPESECPIFGESQSIYWGRRTARPKESKSKSSIIQPVFADEHSAMGIVKMMPIHSGEYYDWTNGIHIILVFPEYFTPATFSILAWHYEVDYHFDKKHGETVVVLYNSMNLHEDDRYKITDPLKLFYIMQYPGITKFRATRPKIGQIGGPKIPNLASCVGDLFSFDNIESAT
jgi:hypothetical protein